MNKKQLDEAIIKTLNEEEAQKLVEQMRSQIICKNIAINITYTLQSLRVAQIATSPLYCKSHKEA